MHPYLSLPDSTLATAYRKMHDVTSMLLSDEECTRLMKEEISGHFFSQVQECLNYLADSLKATEYEATFADIEALILQGVQPVIKVRKQDEEQLGEDFDAHMLVRITAVNKKETTEDGVMYTLQFDWSEFVDHNTRYMKSTYYDGNSKPTLKWIETRFYPRTHRMEVYVMADQKALIHQV